MITILTPVFNRIQLIDRLYQSLISQTCHDFEWVVVDDGSRDNLRNYIEQKQSEAGVFFDIKYIYQENGGKHRALNNGYKFASGEYTFIVDSDDYLTEDAIEKVTRWISDVKDNDKIAAVSGLKGRVVETKVINVGDFPEGKTVVDATNLERIQKHLMGDKAEVYKTDILRRYPFPEFEGEKMIPESAVWNQIALDGYKVRWYNEIIYVCEYLQDGLTMQGTETRIKNNLNGYIFDAKITAKNLIFPYNYINLGSVIKVCKEMKMSAREIRGRLEINNLDIAISLFFINLANLKNQLGSRKGH